jgi:pyruvate-formate lyase-activating enzyme
MVNDVCKSPFYYIEVFDNGDVYNYNPCPNYFKWTTIGNIYQNSIENIWNSDKAKLIRRKVLKNNFSEKNIAIYCANANQTIMELKSVNLSDELLEIMPLPKVVKFSHDKECNVRCVTCRKNIFCNSPEQLNDLDNRIDKYYLPLLENAELVCLNGSGDTLASRHGRKLIKRIVQTYPKIKFALHTNGILCNEKVLTDLNIIDKLSIIEISIHATTKSTYNKFVIDGDFDKVNKNIAFLSNLKKINKLNELLLLFVVTNFNYKEIHDFVNFAQNNNAKCIFWTYKNWGIQTKNEEKEFCVFEKEHPNFNNLKTIIQNIDNNNVYFNYLLEKIKTLNN